jgi:hypothetical protein
VREGASILRGYDAGLILTRALKLRRNTHDTLTHYLGCASPIKGYEKKRGILSLTNYLIF